MKKLILLTICLFVSFILNAQMVYVKDLKDNEIGSGKKEDPYRTIENAVKYAKNGDTIHLLGNIVHRGATTFVIDKAVTIIADKNDIGIQFRGMHLELKADVVFKDIALKFVPDSGDNIFNPNNGKNSSRIYVSDHKVVFDNVSTLISDAQPSVRPTLFAGSNKSETSGSGANIIFKNSTEQTRFRKIWLGSENFPKANPTTIKLDAFVKSDENIDLSGGEGLPVNAKVEVESSSKINKFTNVGKTADNKVTIKNINLYNVQFSGLSNLNLENAKITTDNSFLGLNGNLTIDEQSSLTINDKKKTISVENVLGSGELIIPLIENALTVKQNIDDKINIKLDNMFIYNLADYTDKFYVLAKSGNPTVTLRKEEGGYSVSKQSFSDGVKWTITKATLGVKDVSTTSQIQLYPTLVSSDFHLKSKVKIEDIKIFDLSGKLVKSFTPNAEHRYSISSLAKGIYIVTVNSGKESQSFKIVKD